MLDILLPKPVFKWQDPTLVPRFSHGFESEDADFNKIKNGTPRKTLHTIIHRLKFSDGKISWVSRMTFFFFEYVYCPLGSIYSQKERLQGKYE